MPSRRASIRGWCFDANAADVCESSGRFFLRILAKAKNGAESRKLVAEALKEHKDVNELLTQISRLKPTDKNFDEKMETLFENVDHHVEQEEGEIFQFVEENCSEE